MKRWIYGLCALLAIASSCNKDDVIVVENAPQIILEETSCIVKVGREATIAPTYRYVDEARYRWTIDEREVGTDPVLRFTGKEVGRLYARITVTTPHGEAREEVRIEVVASEAPVVSLPGAGQGFTMALGSVLELRPVVSESSLPTRYDWQVDGESVSGERVLRFAPDQRGDYTLRFEAANEDGSDGVTFVVHVLPPDEMPLSWQFDRTRFSLSKGRTIRLAPQELRNAEGARFAWTVDGDEVHEGDEPFLLFTGSVEGEHRVTVTASVAAGETTATLTQELVVTVAPPAGTYRREATSASRAEATRVYEFLPAPGQFVNEYYTATTMEEACAYALEQLEQGYLLSLGGFGGRVVVGFDHSIAASGAYDLAIAGNSFASSSEPGIVWVMQDENGDGLPNDTWYELRGSESGKASTWQDYAVTYYRPAAPRTAVAWTDNRGASGEIDCMNFHLQDSYYPAWVEADSYTLRGTRLEAHNYQLENGDWMNPPYEWGYADNFSPIDRLTEDDNTQAGATANHFRIADAMRFDGEDAGLEYIDFVMVQTALNTKSGHVGENSTEVLGIYDYHLRKQ